VEHSASTSAESDARAESETAEPRTETVEFQAVACILMRESEYFKVMLADGFSETAAKRITYHADSQQGKLGCFVAPLKSV
jgi:hypothetical protein